MGRIRRANGNGNGDGNGDGNGTPPAPDPYVDEVKSLNPIAYWRLSDPLGSAEAKDEIGQPALLSGNNPGAVLGTVLFDQAPLNLSDPNATSAHFDGDRLRRGRPRRRLRDAAVHRRGARGPGQRRGSCRRGRQHVLVPHCRRRVGTAHRPALQQRRRRYRRVFRAGGKRWLRSGRWSSSECRLTSQSSAPPGTWRSRSTAWIHLLLGWSEGRLGFLAVRREHARSDSDRSRLQGGDPGGRRVWRGTDG